MSDAVPDTPFSASTRFLRIEPAGFLLPVDPGQSLLEAARAAGVLLPSSCRVGTCRTCRCRMTEGQVNYRVEWPGLSPEEHADGEVLPCVALAQSDRLTLWAPAAGLVPTPTD